MVNIRVRYYNNNTNAQKVLVYMKKIPKFGHINFFIITL